MSNIEDLPAVVASEIQGAIDNEAQDATQSMHEAEIKLEEKRIKAQERMHNAELEHELKLEEMKQEREDYKSMLDDFLARVNTFFGPPQTSVEIDASHPEEIIPANEDVSSPEIPEEAPQEAEELVEEIGGEAEAQNPLEENKEVETPKEEVENADDRKSSRRRRRGRR